MAWLKLMTDAVTTFSKYPLGAYGDVEDVCATIKFSSRTYDRKYG